MGLYNTIKLKEPPKCPICGELMRAETEEGEWQSKETVINGKWEEPYMGTFSLENMTSGEIHGACEHCDSFVELRVHDGKVISGELR